MIVLGIGDHVSCGSCLVKDGNIVGVITDERLVREKMVFGVPRESIAFQLDYFGIKPSEIDMVAIGTKNQHLIDGYVDFREGWFGVQPETDARCLF